MAGGSGLSSLALCANAGKARLALAARDPVCRKSRRENIQPRNFILGISLLESFFWKRPRERGPSPPSPFSCKILDRNDFTSKYSKQGDYLSTPPGLPFEIKELRSATVQGSRDSAPHLDLRWRPTAIIGLLSNRRDGTGTRFGDWPLSQLSAQRRTGYGKTSFSAGRVPGGDVVQLDKKDYLAVVETTSQSGWPGGKIYVALGAIRSRGSAHLNQSHLNQSHLNQSQLKFEPIRRKRWATTRL